jgi:hypothetical protein
MPSVFKSCLIALGAHYVYTLRSLSHFCKGILILLNASIFLLCSAGYCSGVAAFLDMAMHAASIANPAHLPQSSWIQDDTEGVSVPN